MYQKTIIIGRIGKKKHGYTPKTQRPVTRYTLATSEWYKNKETGSFEEETEWHNLVSFDKCAEFVESKFEPGDVIQVEGKLKTRTWKDNDGIDRNMTEIIVFDFPVKLPRYYTKEMSGPASNQDHGQPIPSVRSVGEYFASETPVFGGLEDSAPR